MTLSALADLSQDQSERRETLSFGHYLEQVCIANESSLVYDDSVVHQKGLSSRAIGR